MKAKLRWLLCELRFQFDYRIGRILTSSVRFDDYREYMFRTYPHEYENEIKYLEERNAS